MIAVCPKCSARYRVDTARLGPEGARLRCTKCQALFLVRVPAASAPVAGATGSAATPPGLGADPALLVVVADPDESRGKATAEALRSWGVGAHLVHDGVEAMLAIQRLMPRAVVLDAALPRMYGFQVCEIVKRNASLRHMTVVLVGAVHDANRYRRDPSDLYGADHFLEAPDLPDGLRPLLGAGGAGSSAAASVASAAAAPSAASVVPAAPAAARPSTPAASAPRPAPVAATSPIVPSAPPAPSGSPAVGAGGGDPAREEERERARRLARIAVSEMLLYQPEKFAQAAREGTLEKLLELEIQEARALLRQRIGPEVRAEGDFVLEELHRVARERGAKA